MRIIVGDALQALDLLPDQSVRCVVTSPPYWGLRDYGVAGQLGLEKTPDEYVANLVGVFREVRRVLRDDGTLWLNLGDSYAGSGRGGHVGNGSSTLQGSIESEQECRKARGSQLAPGLHAAAAAAGAIGRAWVPPPTGLKQKDLVGIPWMVAFALRTDGWYLRSDIIWHKPNPMPSSARDRPTVSHEYLFLLSKQARYFYDATAIDEPVSASYAKDNRPDGVLRQKLYDGSKYVQSGMVERLDGAVADFKPRRAKRNKRSVWTISPKPFKGAHFATFPPDLIEPCILAGSRPGDTVLDPFGGSGTTALVAQKHGRDAILIELNPAYAEMARKRCA